MRWIFLCRTFNEHSRSQWLDNLRCTECGSVFIGNNVDAAELAEANRSIDATTYYAMTAEASAQKFNTAVRDLAMLVPLSAAILDIGGGNGAFARALYQHGFSNISIHEIPGSAIPEIDGATPKIFHDIDYSTIPTTSFDVVTMMDVLEHVPDLVATLAAAWRVLKSGGIFYAHTPVVTRLDRVMHTMLKIPCLGAIGRTWQRARTSIFHLQNFEPGALSRLVERHGFTVVAQTCINELSWPIELYIQVYLVDRKKLPKSLRPAAVAVLAPLLRSRMNLNKGIVIARRREVTA
jgi:SAM-dependent methyltransferase